MALESMWTEMLGRTVYEVEARAWVAAHPAMRRAVLAVEHAEHEAELIEGILRDLYDEANPPPPTKFPDEGKSPDEAAEREKKVEQEEAALLTRLKEAVKAYNIPAPTPKPEPTTPKTADDLRAVIEAAAKPLDFGDMIADVIKDKFGVDLASLTGEKKESQP